MENSHNIQLNQDTEQNDTARTYKMAEEIVSNAISGATQIIKNSQVNTNENHGLETSEENPSNGIDLKRNGDIENSSSKSRVENPVEEPVTEKLVNGDGGDIVNGNVDKTAIESADDNTVTGNDSEAGANKEDEKKDEWMLILGHEKLKKKVVEKGHGSRPKQSQEVTINYSASLEDGTMVESMKDLRFTLGEQDFIHAFDLCICLMDEGEKCLLVSHPQYAYGELGRKPDIPSNAWLNFEIELVKVDDAIDYASLPLSQKIDIAEKKRQRGNYLYERSDFSTAINVYNRTITILETGVENQDGDTGDLQKLLDIKIKCYNNLAASQLKVEAWDAAIRSCDSVLKYQPQNVKALFRKGKCLHGKGDTQEAIKALRKAVAIDPDSKIAQQELTRLVSKQKKEEESTKNMYQRMLGTDKYLAKKKEMEESSARKSSWSWYVGGAITAAVVSAGFAAYRYLHM